MRRSQEKNDDIGETRQNVVFKQEVDAIGNLNTEAIPAKGSVQPAAVSAGVRPLESSNGREDPPARLAIGDGSKESQSGFLASVMRKAAWVPKRCRYDPEDPPEFSLPMNILFGVVSYGHYIIRPNWS
jgi:hypothetical protein